MLMKRPLAVIISAHLPSPNLNKLEQDVVIALNSPVGQLTRLREQLKSAPASQSFLNSFGVNHGK